MTVEQFRTAALRVPGAVESAHMNHPDFRLNGSIFASLGYPDNGMAMVKLTPEQQRDFMKEAPGAFFPCPGAWGKNGSTNVHLGLAKKRVVNKALRVASKPLLRPTQ